MFIKNKDNVINNTADNKSLTTLQKIVLFAFMSLIVGFYQFIMNLLVLNTGIGEIRYIRLYLQVLPALYIIHMNFWKRSLKFPHLIPFILMISGYVLFEEYLSLSRDVDPHYYNFFWNQLRIYIFFLMLVNFGLNRVVFYKVIDYAFYPILLICLITYVGYLGFFEMAFEENINPFIIKASLIETTKPSHVLHVNWVSYLFSFAILLLIIKQLNEKAFSKVHLLRDFTAILMLFGMITINAARGAFLISVILTFYYIYFLWRHGLRNINIKVFTFFVILISIIAFFRTTNVLENFKSSESQVSLTSRFQQDFTEERYNNMLRVINARNAWENFLEHPFTGVGYFSAAKRGSTGTISDGQHLHILASYGIIFFIIYIYYHYKLFVFKFNLLKKPVIALSLICVVVTLSFIRPGNIFAILGYIAVFFYHESKSIHSKKSQLIGSPGKR